MMTQCKNCDQSFEGNFCPNCSQKSDTHRLNLKHLIHEVTHALTHTDKGIFLLVKAMLRQPGLVVKEYVEGKRKKYFNPFTFILIMMAVQAFAIKQTNFFGKFTEHMKTIYAKMAEGHPESEKRSQAFEEQMQRASKQGALSTEYSKILNFVFIPFLSFLTWLFFRKAKYNYAENLVLNVFLGGELVVIFLIFCILPVLIKPSLVLIVMYLFIAVTFAYNILAYKQFYGQTWLSTIVKGLVVQLIYFVILGITSDLMVKYLA